MKLETARIAFIGTGNMASALIQGLINQGIKASHIHAADINEDALQRMKRNWPVKTFTDNKAALEGVDVVVLAVKPQVLPLVVPNLAQTIQANQSVVISIAAGITTDKLTQWLGDTVPIVRCMPNTPAMVEKGATGLFANNYVSVEQQQLTEQLLQSVGITHWVENESHIDAITALSGSGPAYFFYMIESMVAAGINLGLSPALSKDFALQTALGAAQLAILSDDSPEILRQKVTSPGGTTAAAINVFEQRHMKEIIQQAIYAADQRAKELA